MQSLHRTSLVALAAFVLGLGSAWLGFRDELARSSAEPTLPAALRIDPAEEHEEYLEAILALEQLYPTFDRSPGYLMSRRADRHIAASRLLTDRHLASADKPTLSRLASLRAAVDRYADDLAEAASSHVPAANSPYREVRMALSRLEDRLRALALADDTPLALAGSPDSVYLQDVEARVDAAPCELPESLMPAAEAAAAARTSKQRLKAGLPALRAALRELPEVAARPLEAELRAWVEDFLPEPN